MTRANARQETASWADQAALNSYRTLIIGDLDRWVAAGRETVPFENFQFCKLEKLTTDVLRDFAPDMVLSPLMGDTFDVLTVAAHLRRLGYKGCYRAISMHMPDADVVCAEVAEIAPALDFDLLLMPKTAG